MKHPTLRVAIIQEGPVYLNLRQSMEKAEILVGEAVSQQAELIVFGETWLSGYPAWLDYCPDIALWGHEPTKSVFARMYQNAIAVPGNETRQIAQWAKRFGVTIVMGVNEKIERGPGTGTLYNSLLIFADNGQLAVHHQKLMPTFTEKLVYGHGQKPDLKTLATPAGNIGGLICWEHWMPLARQTMHNAGETIHIALWPAVHEMHQIASRHYAFEGRCFVIAAGQIMRVSDLPPELDLPDNLRATPDEMLLNGGSAIIAPDGFYDLKPQYETEGILIHEIDDLEQVIRERMTLDVTGHYQRPDIFDFKIRE
ncbi:MAG: carbon-nitrogen hydrolase family protein [Bacteroidetes bacterium]|nr:MAG: carbon-nitrogen hydrolase family protein [Bacteroidota bacterium]